MANQEHLAILKGGIQTWNRWRSDTKKIPDLNCADLGLADLSNANLGDANLGAADLNNANLCSTNLSCANLNHANLVVANLTQADLTCASLCNADLCDAHLHIADLRHASFNNADLSGADLSGANLSGANLGGANLSGADLRDADLTEAGLIAANFYGANLNGANLKNAVASSTKFLNCDLSEVKGLDFVKHAGPSTIGIDTIYTSKGRISESFLRGCGVPDAFITQMHSLVGAVDGIQFYSCFISYSGKDEDFARRLHGRMRDAHLRVWFAPEDIQGGKKLHEQIETAIRIYDKLLIVLSEASLQSEWVMTELRKARKAELQSGKRKLFPVRLVDFTTLRDWECFDADRGKDLAVELREYFIPDFSNWKDHDQFEGAFARLLKDLRAEESAKGLADDQTGLTGFPG